MSALAIVAVESIGLRVPDSGTVMLKLQRFGVACASGDPAAARMLGIHTAKMS